MIVKTLLTGIASALSFLGPNRSGQPLSTVSTGPRRPRPPAEAGFIPVLLCGVEDIRSGHLSAEGQPSVRIVEIRTAPDQQDQLECLPHLQLRIVA